MRDYEENSEKADGDIGLYFSRNYYNSYNERSDVFMSKKEELNNIWKEYKERIKIGGICLLVGGTLGFIKGVISIKPREMLRLQTPDDVYDWLYYNLDRPDVLEEIRKTFTEIDTLKD